MFRVTFFCEDKKLSELLRAASGLVAANPEVLPVVNVEPVGGKLRAKSNGDYRQMFLAYCKQHKITEFGPAQGKQITKAVGMSPLSFNYLARKLKEAGALKSAGKFSATRYTVIL